MSPDVQIQVNLDDRLVTFIEADGNTWEHHLPPGYDPNDDKGERLIHEYMGYLDARDAVEA